MKKIDLDHFYNLGIDSLKTLETKDGILASSKQEIYGCLFGRDSLITCIKLLRAYRYHPNPYFIDISRKILEGMFKLQGKVVNIESGEEPGKCIHEFRPTNHEHLTKNANWHCYQDGTMRNFDSVDSTSLLLIAAYRYWQQSRDDDFIKTYLPNIQSALDWILKYGDKNNDGFIDYQIPSERKCGGLTVQSWMDSSESIFHEDRSLVVFPIAPVEVQAYTYLTLKLWANYFELNNDILKSADLTDRAQRLKKIFNMYFVLNDEKCLIASAIAGDGKPVTSIRSTAGHILWASMNRIDDNQIDCILNQEYINSLAKRLIASDLFEPLIGLRTLSKHSNGFKANSYHNGSIWPHDNSMIADGFENHELDNEAQSIRTAILNSFCHFDTPLELYSYDNDCYHEYCTHSGQTSCKVQAWSVASMICNALALKKLT